MRIGISRAGCSWRTADEGRRRDRGPGQAAAGFTSPRPAGGLCTCGDRAFTSGALDAETCRRGTPSPWKTWDRAVPRPQSG